MSLKWEFRTTPWLCSTENKLCRQAICKVGCKIPETHRKDNRSNQRATYVFFTSVFGKKKKVRTTDVLGCQVETHGNIRQKKIGQRIQAGVGAKVIPAAE